MKKLLALMMAMLLVVCAAAIAEEDYRTFCNPNNYKLIKISDVFIPEIEYVEGEEETEAEIEQINYAIVQCSFGDVDMSNGEADMTYIGFDDNEIFALGLPFGVKVYAPANVWEDPTQNVEMTAEEFVKWFADNQAYYNENLATEEDDGTDNWFTMLAEFEMDADGDFTALSYAYMP